MAENGRSGLRPGKRDPNLPWTLPLGYLLARVGIRIIFMDLAMGALTPGSGVRHYGKRTCNRLVGSFARNACRRTLQVCCRDSIPIRRSNPGKKQSERNGSRLLPGTPDQIRNQSDQTCTATLAQLTVRLATEAPFTRRAERTVIDGFVSQNTRSEALKLSLVNAPSRESYRSSMRAELLMPVALVFQP